LIARLRCGLLLALALKAAPALAFDPFEIQVYDGSIDERHQAGLELHVNRPRHGPLHVTLEPSFGLTDFWELGGYFQTADGRYEGVKLRTKLAVPLGQFRAGVNFELSRIPDEGWGGEIRPILAFENERFLLALNPIVSFPAAFEPAGMAKLKLGRIGLGLEYYATLSQPREQYLFEALDLFGVKDVEVNAAVGQGFGAASGQLIFKSILGYAF
jgi:hypothetical protein